MRGVGVPVAAIVGIVLSAIVGLLVAAVLNTGLSDYWVRGIASCAVGLAVAVQIAQNVLGRHAGRPAGSGGRGPS